MSSPAPVVIRRTWPQRFVILCSVGIIASAVGVSWFLNDVYQSFSELGRVEFASDVLLTDTEPGEPVNFLLIGEDSAEGLDSDDPAAFAREVDSRGFQADSIAVVRVNPTTGQAWVLSLPRDLLVDDRGTERKINSLLLVGGHDLLVETITANFGITINHFISLDFLGFREVVDELGGVPVWFDNPARDYNTKGQNGSGLNIETAGCHVLNGVESLQYVRSRFYQELIDGEWEYLGNVDFGRIQRQQDFLVLALERAIDKGARTPANLSALVSAAAQSLVLDSELSVAELIELGEAFSNFNPENLRRLSLEVDTVGSGSDYQGERARPGANDDVLATFRGADDLVGPAEVSFALYGTTVADTERIAVELDAQGFTVAGSFTLDQSPDENVVVYPTGELSSAETIARYLLPIPRLVEDPDASGISVVLGTDHEQVLFIVPHEVSEMRAAVAALGSGEVPSLDDAVALDPTSTITEAPATTTSSEPGEPDATTTTTTLAAADETPVTTTTAGIIGRPPEGQSCG